MGDYMFMLENRLGAEQFRVLGQVQKLATDAGYGVYLTGSAMRDMLGGFPVRELHFTVEGNALKLAKALEKAGASIDRKSTRLNSSHITTRMPSSA